MVAEVLFELLVRLSFIIIFLAVLGVAIRRPHPSNVRIVLFFGALATAVTVGWVATDVLRIEEPRWLQGLARTLVVTLPYVLLSVVSEFSNVPRWLLRAATVGLILSVVAVLVWAELPVPVVTFIIAYFVAFEIYAAVKFARESRHVHGVTRRRMLAAAAGTVLLSGVLLIAGLQEISGAQGGLVDLVLEVTLLASGVAYLVGFAPPVFLRRAWQEPELRSFLRRVAELPWLEDTASIVRRLEEGAAASLGADRATIALWDRQSRTLRAPGYEPAEGSTMVPGEFIAGQAFQEGRVIFTSDARKTDPAHAEMYEKWNARAIVSAPIVAGDERIGVLSIWGHRTPVFVADDMGLTELLADQAAIVLKSRRLLQEAAEIRARERAVRMKDDFLSAAAHDLRTPLTSIIGSAQLLERKAATRTIDAAEMANFQRLSREATRLSELVAHLLDVAQAEEHPLVGRERKPQDLAALACEVCIRQTTELHPCDVEASRPVIVEMDRARIEELLASLIENGKKFSPDGGTISVRVWREAGPDGDRARISVRDRGIGIPAADHDLVFDRFQRGANVDDRRFSGMGLGLYICRTIAEQHGGRVWLESRVGEGSTFHVELPATGQPNEGA